MALIYFHFPSKHVFYMIISIVNNLNIVYYYILLTFQNTVVLFMLSSLEVIYTNDAELIFQMGKSKHTVVT